MNSHIFRVLSNKRFSLLLLAEVFSQVAFNMMNFILLLVVFKLTRSNAAVSGIVLSFTIPAIFFGLLAGAYVDKWNKKSVLFWTNAVRAFLLLILAFLHTNLFLVYPLSLGIAIVTQFFIPAETPIISLVVPKKLLLSANALFGMGLYGSILVAYALAGPFLILFGQRNVFIFLAFFFLLAAFFISLVKISHFKKEGQENNIQGWPLGLNVKEEIKTAFRIMAKTKAIYQSLFLLTLSQVLILILAVIGPGFAHQVLGIEVNQLPLLFVTPAALGMVVGAIVIGHFFHNAPRRKMASIGLFLGALTVALLPYGSKVASRDIVLAINAYLPRFLVIDILHIVVFLAFVLGFANALMFVPSNTVLQEKTSDEQRGKMYGTLNSLVGIFSLFPIIIVGEMADIFGVSRVLTGVGIGLFILWILRVVSK